MREQTELERSYRRLLWAYPRFYRRDRGLEILTTLLDASEPGQARASLAERVHLLLSGLRCRLVPPGWAGKVATTVATLWMAVVLSGVGAYAAWGSQLAGGADLDDAGIATLSDTLVGGHPAASVDIASSDPLEMAYSYQNTGDWQTFAAEGWSGARPAPAGHTRRYAQVAQGETVLRNAYQHLRDAGWQTGATTGPDWCASCKVFWASRDGLLLRMSVAGEGDRPSMIVVRFHRIEPSGIFPAAIAGFLTGVILTWPVMTWLAHRFSRTPRRDQLLVLLFGLPALYACGANTVDNVLSMVPDPDADGVFLAAAFLYPLANQSANPLAAIVIALGLAGSLGIIACTPWHRLAPRMDSASPTRAVTGD